MLIKVGDYISVKTRGNYLSGYRYGTITNISIGTTKDDIAGESGVSVKDYDTDLKYLGSVSYKNDDSFPDEFWCYFDQIEEVHKGMEEDV
jgi:hypothetical protein|tara:strand:- start:342 stop:611 length:270 start_codon:yes stop_codon:yes gene_type:complete